MNIQKFALGTANFGMDYGTFNTSGRLNSSQVKNILALASSTNIQMLDTAISYGESHKTLGLLGVKNWQVVSKLPPVPNNAKSISEWINFQMRASLDQLNVSSIYGLLLHKPSQLMTDQGSVIWSTLSNLKKSKLVSKIGYSIYNPEELDELWSNFKPDIVQAPFNIVDRRILNSGWLDLLHKNGCEIHIRSIFLQGFLLSKLTNRKKFFKTWTPLWEKYIKWLQDEKLTPLEACLAFAVSFPQVSKIIVGVDSSMQLEQILECKIPKLINFPEDISINDTNLLNPSKWRIS